MKNIALQMKIKKELKEFREFKKTYKFEYKSLRQQENGAIFCGDDCIKENDEAQLLGETENILNVGYGIHNAMSKLLSNLFPYQFYFRGLKLASIESFFQGIKFKNKKAQKLVFDYSGMPSNHIKMASDFDWQETQTIFFQGKAYNRDSFEYDQLIDELYISLLQNPLYRNAIKKVGKKQIIHSIGKEEKSETVFTRFEFEFMLNCLKDFLLTKDK